MEEALHNFMAELPWWMLLVVIAVSIAVLGKGADWVVGEAVVLSERSGIPKVVVGATVVSLGTTTPEAAVSVFAAMQGKPDLALSNAVGSIICDTGLVLGVACLISPLPLHGKIVLRQGFQVITGVLLVVACWPWTDPLSAFTAGGHLSQVWGFVFVVLLVWYLWRSVRWARQDRSAVHLEEFEADASKPVPAVVAKLVFGLVLIVLAAQVLIPAVEVFATLIGVPRAVISATLVAFGTSVPELVTAVTAARRGHGDLALGNVIGADILNVLFVAGLSAAVTEAGLAVDPHFFRILFPGMLLLLATFFVAILKSGKELKRPLGFVLLAVYGLVTILNFVLRGP